LAGADRYSTAVEVAKERWAQGEVTEIYVATGGDSPDAVVGGQLTGGPLLLVRPDGVVPSVVSQFVAEHEARRVVAIGGSAVLPSPVMTQLAGSSTGWRRLSGADRYVTAAAVAYRQFPADADTVYLARADVYADAVASGSLTDGPVLLVSSCGLPSAAAERIAAARPLRVVALGGEGAVCEEVLQEAAAATSAGGGRIRPAVADDTAWPGDIRPSSAAISGDGRVTAMLAQASGGGWQLAVTDAVTGERRIHAVAPAGGTPPKYLTLSSDGSVAAFRGTSADTVIVIEVETGARRNVGPAELGFDRALIGLPRISSDGSTLVLIAAGPTVEETGDLAPPSTYAYDLASGQATLVSAGPDGEYENDKSHAAAVSADGSVIVFVSSPSNLGEGDTEGKLDVLLWRRGSADLERVNVDSEGKLLSVYSEFWSQSVSITDDGRYVSFVTCETDCRLAVRDVEAGTTALVSTDADGRVPMMRTGWITPDGSAVVFDEFTSRTAAPTESRRWYRRDLGTGEVSRMQLDYTGREKSWPVALHGFDADATHVLLMEQYTPGEDPSLHVWEKLEPR
jgi:hypothetical protein